MSVRVISGDCRAVLPTLAAGSVQCCVTSPPYFGLRDYGCDGQIGLEPTPDEYVAALVEVFREVRRVLRSDGTCWLNLGDSYVSNGRYDAAYEAKNNRGGMHAHDVEKLAAVNLRPAARAMGIKPKDLLMIPARVALALQTDGWWLRSDIIWHKPNPMPESVTDRPTSAHEHVFLLTKSARYYFDAEAVREPNCDIVQRAAERYAGNADVELARAAGNIGAAPDRADSGKTLRIDNNAFSNPAGRNIRNVWTIATAPSPLAHFAMMPPEIAERCIKAGSRPGDTILDPFGGVGTSALVADRLGRDAVLIELSDTHCATARARITNDCPLFGDVA